MKNLIVELNKQEIKDVCGGNLVKEGVEAIILAGAPFIGLVVGMSLFLICTKSKAAVIK